MNRIFFFVVFLFTISSLNSQSIEDLKLKDFYPKSIYTIKKSIITKAKYPIIDFHTHDYPKTDGEVDTWVKTMNESGIAKSVILSYSTGARFDSIVAKYARYKDRFDIWCGFDYTGYEQEGWQAHAVAELERCVKMGAKGVGELGDKGLGEFYSYPTHGWGLHIDDVRMKPLIKKCGELKIPISIHVAEDQWMYEKDDATNDGLMNAGKWKVDMTKPGIYTHDQLVKTLENAVRDNPKVTFIACHLANTCSDLSQLGRLFDQYPNLYADIAARFGEISPVPRYAKAFIEKYADRIVFGTDMGTSPSMYQIIFRILESEDEHFYDRDHFNYHWPLHGLGLSAKTLKKIYNGNGNKILKR